MPESYFSKLENRSLITVGGEEAEAFLQGILTCNVEEIKENKAGFGGLLTPQGKILFDFYVIRSRGIFLLDTDEELVDDLIKRLMFYRLRAKVTIEQASTNVYAVWRGGRPALADATIVRDPRLAQMGWRIYHDTAPEGRQKDYHAHRIDIGMPQGGADYAWGETFPHEALYDQIGGVDFNKGCYVGQEVISRVHHRGTARKRLIKVEGENTLPESGAGISAGGKSVGALGSAYGKSGLAMLRLDRVKDAMDAGNPLIVAETQLVASIQPWANFDWPGNT